MNFFSADFTDARGFIRLNRYEPQIHLPRRSRRFTKETEKSSFVSFVVSGFRLSLGTNLAMREISILDIDCDLRRVEQGVMDQAMMDSAFYPGAVLLR